MPSSAGKPHLLIVMLNGSSTIRLDRHIDHDRCAVTYVVDRTRAETIAEYRERIRDAAVVTDPADIDGQVLPAVAELFRRNGTADVVFTPSEYDLLGAARIRDRFGIAGMSEAHTLDLRDKVLMKERVGAAGVVVPRFGACADAVPHELAARIGYPLVLKPRRGMGSRGIHIVHDDAEFARAWPQIDPDDYEAEEFVPGTIYHVDGLVSDGRLLFSRVSRYLTTCLAAQHQRIPLGSVVVDDAELRDRLNSFALRALLALSLDASPFHLELILRADREPVFLEVGARPGGGQIRFVFDDLYGVDLFREWANLALGVQRELPVPDEPVGGWLTVPAPSAPPYRVVEARSLIDSVRYLYYEALPHTGDVYDSRRLSLDRWPGGRFRFAGPTTEVVAAAIEDTMRRYRFTVAAHDS
ncbi:ATP-grasp domain-containing protein [Nocardia terpenica]|nr:ATP-grasp domain-containing protein [Nocardia terpenica]